MAAECEHEWLVELDAGALLRLACGRCRAMLGVAVRPGRSRVKVIECTVFDYGTRGLSMDDLTAAARWLVEHWAGGRVGQRRPGRRAA